MAQDTLQIALKNEEQNCHELVPGLEGGDLCNYRKWLDSCVGRISDGSSLPSPLFQEFPPPVQLRATVDELLARAQIQHRKLIQDYCIARSLAAKVGFADDVEGFDAVIDRLIGAFPEVWSRTGRSFSAVAA